jgi:hypothetical protein
MTVAGVRPAGQKINITDQEERAFWTWASIEILRLTASAKAPQSTPRPRLGG